VSTIRAIFCRRHHWAAPLIRLATWSLWAHVAPIVEDEAEAVVIDATFTYGVARRGLPAVLASLSDYCVKEVDCPDPSAAYDFAREQLGKPYDTRGVLGLALHRDWQADDAWFCSEFFEAMLAAGGNRRFVQQAHRVTPQHSWMVR